jgi:hypothetical protein
MADFSTREIVDLLLEYPNTASDPLLRGCAMSMAG